MQRGQGRLLSKKMVTSFGVGSWDWFGSPQAKAQGSSLRAQTSTSDPSIPHALRKKLADGSRGRVSRHSGRNRILQRRTGLERGTGIEPATLCLEARVVEIVASPDATRQIPLQNGPYRASEPGPAEHLIESVAEACRTVKPSDY